MTLMTCPLWGRNRRRTPDADSTRYGVEGVSEDEFVAMRTARDAKLAAPLLLLPSIQVNIRAGHFPPADVDGVHYLKVPVKLAS